MKHALAAAALAAALCACTSPESTRTRGGGPGADIGNRGQPVVMHAGSKPFHGTPHMSAAKAPPTEPALQAHDLSRR